PAFCRFYEFELIYEKFPNQVMVKNKDYNRLNRKRGSFWRALVSFRRLIERERIFSESDDFENFKDSSSGWEIDSEICDTF
ncbi:MAG: hypothetical protein WAK95_01925, partial [Desulfobacterales bacterium]